MFYNKQTRNSEGVFFRDRFWGVSFLPVGRDDNFTEIEPQKYENGDFMPQDWVDGAWVIAEDELIPREISKLAILDRLDDIDMLSTALNALASDAIKHARWDAATVIYHNDPVVIAVLTALNIDPETILI